MLGGFTDILILLYVIIYLNGCQNYGGTNGNLCGQIDNDLSKISN